MAAVAEETTLTEEEVLTEEVIVPTTEPIMAMEGILTTETVADVQAQKLVVAVAHTTVVGRLVVEMVEDALAQKLDVVEVEHTTVEGHLVVEMEGDVAVVAQETAEDKVRMVVEVVAHVDQDSRVIKL